MFEIRITSLHDFRIFVKIIKGENLDENEIKTLSASLSSTADRLIAAEETQRALEKK